MNILSIQSSARVAGSHSRTLSADLIDVLRVAHHDAKVVHREATASLPLIDEGWLSANWTPADDRTPDQRAALGLSGELIAEVNAADVLVLGVPMYNFSVPASLKAWIDLVARAGETFRYTANGPVGLLKSKKAYVVMTSGGVSAGSPVDFVTPYMRQVLGFIGIDDVEVITADGLVANEAESLERARDAIEVALRPVTAKRAA
jgi:FMN-dependent NADH-azoreductase